MPKNKRKHKLVPMMILSVFLLLAGCGRDSREIIPARETTDDFETTEGARGEQTGETDSAGNSAAGKETAVLGPENKDPENAGPENFTPDDKKLHNEKMTVVHVCGAVNRPGVYTLPEGSRLWEAVKAAGGVAENGAGDYLNMAATVTDGEKVVVPFLDDVEEPFGAAETLSSQPKKDEAAGLVNLNTAGLEQLMTLPGIGESKAKAILEYREKTGLFTAPEDITNVPGIKKGSYEKLKSYITI